MVLRFHEKVFTESIYSKIINHSYHGESEVYLSMNKTLLSVFSVQTVFSHDFKHYTSLILNLLILNQFSHYNQLFLHYRHLFSINFYFCNRLCKCMLTISTILTKAYILTILFTKVYKTHIS